MVEIKLTFNSIDEAIAFMSKAPAAAAPVAQPAKEKAAPKPPAEPQKAAAASGPAPAPAAAPASASAELPTYEKSGIGEKIAGFIGQKDSEGYAERRQAVVGLLGEFGVANGKQLKPEQFTPFLDKLNALG